MPRLPLKTGVYASIGGLLIGLAVVLCCIIEVTEAGSINWSASNTGQLLKNGAVVSLKGMSFTCLEYLLEGIGGDCIAQYNFANRSALITQLNQPELDAMYALLLPAPSGVQPAIRLQINAGYYLDVETERWSLNRAENPNLAGQYRQLIDLVVRDATTRGVVIILDLHWNDDISQFSETALKGSVISGDSLTFWNTVAQTYAGNDLVFYDMFNAPHIDSYTVWMEGNAQFEGMRKMVNAVLSKNVKGMVIVAGQRGFAYDAQSLIQFAQDVPTATLIKVIFAFQPFAGVQVGNDAAKSVEGFIERVDQVISITKRPIVLTQIGQFCCAAESVCVVHDGEHLGRQMGYVRAILFEATLRNISWFGFGWRPGVGNDCNQPDMNAGFSLYNSDLRSGLGANWNVLYPTFYAGDLAAALNDSPIIVTSSPTIGQDAPTEAPETQPPAADAEESNAVSIVAPIGGGVGGAIFALAALGLFWFQKQRRAASEEKRRRIEADIATWTDNEVRALEEKWQTTHDFEELCSVVPHRNRESVAWKAKSFQTKTKSTFVRNLAQAAPYVPSERFAFVQERARRAAAASAAPKQSLRPGQSQQAHEPSVVHTPSYVSPSASMAMGYQQESTNPMFGYSLRTTVSY